MNYVGIDHHRQYSHLTLMDQTGQVLRSGRVPNLQTEIAKFLEGSEAVEAVIETGRPSYTMVDVLEEMGVAVKIAHPNEVKAIARAKIKTDKRDSEVLAHLLRMNMVPEVYRRSPENRQAQRVLRQIVRTIPGFGKFLSVLVTVEIADIARFSDSAHLHAYAGVIPSTHSSGDRTHHGKIVRAGNRWLRWAAVEAVWPAIRADFDLRCFYERLARGKGANKAKVATARRLLTIIYKVLKEGRNYIAYRR